ncbi:MAG TPA: hypothetical protein VMU69_11845 [Bradyrhizobium sp.]|nr:hypothetical protein [Bradyrhizobium sp.]
MVRSPFGATGLLLDFRKLLRPQRRTCRILELALANDKSLPCRQEEIGREWIVTATAGAQKVARTAAS